MLACLAITLKSDKKRLRSLEAELARVGLPCVYIEGVPGMNLEDPDVYRELQKEFPEYLPQNLREIPLRPGEIGCYLSCIRAFRYSISHGFEHVLIIEDDVKFSFDDPTVLQGLTQIDLSWDQIKLAHTNYPLVKGIFVGSRTLAQQKFNFYFYWRGITGTTCNLYTRAGIHKLLKNCPRWGLREPIDALVANKRYLMDFLPIFVRPEQATENSALESSVIPGRRNEDAFTRYLEGQGFWQRKKKQIQRIVSDCRRPLHSLIELSKKSMFVWFCLKYLLWRRKQPGLLKNHTLLGSSVVSANVFLFRRLGVKIPWLDPLWVVPDVLIGAVYWFLHPSQYHTLKWWSGLTKRRFEFRSFAAKPGELSAWRIFCLARQAGYYGRWLRHTAFNPPAGIVMWNGWRTTWAQKALSPPGLKTWFFENAPFPACLTMDPQGVNAGSYLPRNPDFYRAWARLNPNPAISWASIPDIIAQRPVSPKSLSSDLALLDELPEKFIFVPLQKQDDSQIYLHAGWVQTVDNFIRVVYTCCPALPQDWKVIVKTHPSDHDIEPEVVFQNRPGNVFNGANFDSIELLKACSGVVNINGSMGLQAYLFGKPSVVLGNSFYGFGGMASCCNSAEELREMFARFENLRFDAHLRGCFMNFLLNHYYLRVPEELPRQIVSGKLQRCRVDEAMIEQVSDRLMGRWDPWAGLSDDPQRWADLLRSTPIAPETNSDTRSPSAPQSHPADPLPGAGPEDISITQTQNGAASQRWDQPPALDNETSQRKVVPGKPAKNIRTRQSHASGRSKKSSAGNAQRARLSARAKTSKKSS